MRLLSEPKNMHSYSQLQLKRPSNKYPAKLLYWETQLADDTRVPPTGSTITRLQLAAAPKTNETTAYACGASCEWWQAWPVTCRDIVALNRVQTNSVPARHEVNFHVEHSRSRVGSWDAHWRDVWPASVVEVETFDAPQRVVAVVPAHHVHFVLPDGRTGKRATVPHGLDLSGTPCVSRRTQTTTRGDAPTVNLTK